MTNESISDSATLDMSSILSKLEQANLPIIANEEYLDNSSPYKQYPISLKDYESLNLTSDLGVDTLSFLWKHVTADWILVCLQTSTLYAKGMTDEYILISLGEGLIPQDKIIWVGNYAIPTENPNGGTSSGVEYRTGTIDMLGQTITTSYEGITQKFVIDYDGKFIEQKEVAEPIKLDKPYYDNAKLIDIVNNIDYTTFEFEIDDKPLSFNYQLPNMFPEGNVYFEFDYSTGAVVPPIKVRDGMRKEYRIRYEYQYFENNIQEMDTNMVLTGIGEVHGGMEPTLRTFFGAVQGYDDNGDYFILSVKEDDTKKVYDFIVLEEEYMQAVKDELGLDVTIEMLWDWQELDNPGEGAIESYRVLYDYNLKQ